LCSWLIGLVMGALPSLALAKDQALYDKGVEMMEKATVVLEDAVATVKKGKEMYVQIA